jgi:capsular polysaccharide biosynthesis protein
MNLQLFAAILWTRRYVIGAVVIVTLLCSPMLVRMLRPSYVAVSELSYVGSGSPSNVNSQSNAVLPSTDLPDFIMSSRVIERAIQKIGLASSVNEVAPTISVKSSMHSNLVPISVKMKDPVAAVNLANALADAAVDEYKAIAAHQYDEILSEIDRQMQAERRVMQENDAKLQHAVQQDYAIGSSNAPDDLTRRLDELETQRGIAYATYLADNATASAQSMSGSERGLQSAIHEQVLANDPTYQAVRAVQSKDEAALAAMRGGYTSSFEAFPGLEEQVRSERSSALAARAVAIRDHAGNSATYAQVVLNQHTSAAQAAGDRARLSAIDQNITQAKLKLADLPRVFVAANMFRVQRDGATAAYQQLQTRYQQTLADRAQATALGAAFVLDRAAAAAPRTPPLITAFLISLIIFALAGGAAYLAEILDPRVRTAASIEELYGAPRIGSV